MEQLDPFHVHTQHRTPENEKRRMRHVLTVPWAGQEHASENGCMRKGNKKRTSFCLHEVVRVSAKHPSATLVWFEILACALLPFSFLPFFFVELSCAARVCYFAFDSCLLWNLSEFFIQTVFGGCQVLTNNQTQTLQAIKMVHLNV